MVSFKWAKGIYFQDALFNDFNNDNTTMWFIFLCIYLYLSKGYDFSMMVRRSTMSAPIDGPTYRSHSGFDICECPCRRWCGWRFNHDEKGKVGMPWYRCVA